MTTAPSLVAAAAPVRRRRRWLWLLLLGLPLAFMAGSVIVVWFIGSSNLDKAFAEADRLDPGWRLEELETKRLPFPPLGKNGADQLRAIKAALPGPSTPYPLNAEWSFPAYQNNAVALAEARKAMSNSLSPMSVDARRSPTVLNDEQARVLLEEQEKTIAALGLARDLVNFPYGRTKLNYPPDYFFRGRPPLPPIEEALIAAELLHFHALLRAHKGDLAGALHDVRAMLYARRSLGDEPAIQMIAANIAYRTTLTLERTLGLGVATEKDLAAVQLDLQEEIPTPFFLTDIRGQRAYLDLYFAAVQTGAISFTPFRQASWSLGIAPDWPGEWQILQAYLTIRSQRAECLRLMNELVELAKLPTGEQVSALRAWEGKLNALPERRLARNLLTGHGNMIIHDWRAKAMLRSAIAGVAAERFRLTHGRWPAQLSELVPQYLDAVPVDPFDGRPLRLKLGDGVFIVYSVGLDEHDDGGELDHILDTPGSDIGFRLFDPAKRRQPAKPFEIP